MWQRKYWAVLGFQALLARRIAVLPERWPEAPAPVQSLGDIRLRGAATAMDLSPDGRLVEFNADANNDLTCLVLGDAILGAEVRSGVFAFTWLSPVSYRTIVAGRSSMRWGFGRSRFASSGRGSTN